MNGLYGVMLACVVTAGVAVGQSAPGTDRLNTPSVPADREGMSGEAPLDTPSVPGGKDASAVSSPVSPMPVGTSIRVGSEVRVTVTEAVSSGVQINGAPVHGRLAGPVRTSAGTLPLGTVVEGTVVSSAKAGEIASGGVLSVQLTRVGGVHVVTDVLDFNGAEGHKDVADSAPARGSEAMVAGGTTLSFHVMEVSRVPGLIPGVAPAKGAAPANGAPSSDTGSPNTGPGVNQVPVKGATTGVTPK